MNQQKKTEFRHIAVDPQTYERISTLCEKASDIVGVRITKMRLVKGFADNYAADILRKYESAVAALKKEKLF